MAADTANPVGPQQEPQSPETTPQYREALQYWGDLVKPDKCGTQLLNRLLSGIAHYIANTFEPNDCPDLNPQQLAAFYRAVGGNYDILFVETPPSSIAFIYKSLGCLHSLQPAADNNGYQPPVVPSLKARGFVTWQTIQLLLGPEEHVPFLQSAVAQFEVIDPENGQRFPNILPKEAFPEKPNQEMLDWYEQVSEKLRQEAEAPVNPNRVSLSASDISAGESGDERNEAAKWFSNPMYKDNTGRPGIVRGYSRASPRSPRQVLEDRGRQVMHSVRHFWNPQVHPHLRRRSLPEKQMDDYYYEEQITPTHLHPRYAPRQQRTRSPSLTSDSEDEPQPPRRAERSPKQSPFRESPGSKQGSSRTSPKLRHHRSHELPPSPREYFPPYYGSDRRNSSATQVAPAEGFAPSKEPLFAAKVARAQSKRASSRNVSEDRNGRLREEERSSRLRDEERASRLREGERSSRLRDEERSSSYKGQPAVRYSRHNVEPIVERPVYTRARRSRDLDDFGKRSHSYDRDASYDRDVDRLKTSHRYVEGTHGRRYPVESPWR